MATSELKQMIDLYFDGELKPGEEPVLFMLLSKDDEARRYFKKHHLLKTVTEKMSEDFPAMLEEKIFNKVFTKTKPGIFRRKLSPVFVYPVMAILLAVGLFFYSEVNNYRSDLTKIHSDLQQQNKTIELLMHSLPNTEVKAKFSNEVLIKSN